jgi:hypothetical protein
MRTPAIGVGWDARRLLAILTATCLVGAMFLVYAGTAMADHLPPDAIVAQDAGAGTNEGPYWVDYLESVRGISDATCVKINQSGSSAFVMPAAPAGEEWVLLVVKQATDNFLYYDPVGGHTYPSTGPQAPGYSHLIVCSVPETPATTTTTVEDTTTTSVEETTTTSVEDTTTTSVEDTTTTTVQETTTTSVEDTTTTTVQETTTTSVEDTTTTSVEDTTTTTVEETTTTAAPTKYYCDPETQLVIEVEAGDSRYEDAYDTSDEAWEDEDCVTVLPTVVTTTIPDEVDDEELPFTGIDTDVLLGLAMTLLAAGAVLLVMTRRVEDSN